MTGTLRRDPLFHLLIKGASAPMPWRWWRMYLLLHRAVTVARITGDRPGMDAHFVARMLDIPARHARIERRRGEAGVFRSARQRFNREIERGRRAMMAKLDRLAAELDRLEAS